MCECVLLHPSIYLSFGPFILPFVVATSEEQRVEREVARDENLICRVNIIEPDCQGEGEGRHQGYKEKDAL